MLNHEYKAESIPPKTSSSVVESATNSKGNCTPGPWKAQFTQRYDVGPWRQATIQAPDGNFISQLYGGRPDTAWDEDTVNANARLIAAAPTMFSYIEKKSRGGDEEATRILAEINA